MTGTGIRGCFNLCFGFQYRASGAIKQLNYGNGLSLDRTYNARLQSKSFDVHSSSASVLKSGYQYNADGAIRTVDDQLDNLWDRSYSTDFAGRLTAASAGPGTAGMPYYETFGHDAFDNLTNRITEMWADGGSGFTASYVNDRRQSNSGTTWQHDASGNVLSIAHANAPEYQQYVIDAAGQTTQDMEHSRHDFGPQASVITRDITIDQTYDGNGQRLKRVESKTTQLNNNNPTSSQKVTYDLRSTVLGGRVITELSSGGAKDRGYVFVGGELLAVQQQDYLGNDQVLWSHTDPVTATSLQTNSSGQVNSAAESQRSDFDPMGGAIPPTDPALVESSFIDGAMSRGWYMTAGDPYNSESGCAWNGLSTSCRNFETIMRGRKEITLLVGRNFGMGISIEGTRTRTKIRTLQDPNKTNPKTGALVTDHTAIRDVVTLSASITFFGTSFVSQVQTTPNLPRGTSQKHIQPFTNAFNAARKRLQNSSCASLFNLTFLGQMDPIAVAEMELNGERPNFRLETLEATNYRILSQGAPRVDPNSGEVRVIGAATYSSRDVFVNSQGPLFDIKPNVPGKGVVSLDLGTGLNQTEFGAFLLLHELGHQVGLFGLTQMILL